MSRRAPHPNILHAFFFPFRKRVIGFQGYVLTRCVIAPKFRHCELADGRRSDPSRGSSLTKCSSADTYRSQLWRWQDQVSNDFCLDDGTDVRESPRTSDEIYSQLLVVQRLVFEEDAWMIYYLFVGSCTSAVRVTWRGVEGLK